MDPEEQTVDVTTDLGSLEDFLKFSKSDLTLTVDDLSEQGISAGFYEISFTLEDDRGNQVLEYVLIDVREPDPDEVVQDEDTEKSFSEESSSSNSTQNTTEDTSFDWR